MTPGFGYDEACKIISERRLDDHTFLGKRLGISK